MEAERTLKKLDDLERRTEECLKKARLIGEHIVQLLKGIGEKNKVAGKKTSLLPLIDSAPFIANDHPLVP